MEFGQAMNHVTGTFKKVWNKADFRNLKEFKVKYKNKAPVIEKLETLVF